MHLTTQTELTHTPVHEAVQVFTLTVEGGGHAKKKEEEEEHARSSRCVRDEKHQQPDDGGRMGGGWGCLGGIVCVGWGGRSLSTSTHLETAAAPSST